MAGDMGCNERAGRGRNGRRTRRKSIKNEENAEDELEDEESSISNYVRDRIASADDGDVREFMARGAIRIRL